jgi:hypothetical protein
MVSAAGVGGTAALAVVPAQAWLLIASAMRVTLAFSAGGALTACWLGSVAIRLWEPTRWLTFAIVQAMLAPVVPSLVVEPDKFRIATRRFGVIVAPECSGLQASDCVLYLAFFGRWRSAAKSGFADARFCWPALPL